MSVGDNPTTINKMDANLVAVKARVAFLAHGDQISQLVDIH
jgi:hypothetical protein